MIGYDTMYQDWNAAYEAKDYETADAIRDEFERLHGLTIFASGDMPIEDVTVRRMTKAKWIQKFQPDNTAALQAVHASDGIYQSPLPTHGVAR